MNKIDLYGDGIGYVAIVDKMGDEYTPAEDARMSTGKGRLGEQKDKALQERLLTDAHTSPFEGAIVKLEICTPLFVLRELDRHRTLDKVGEDDPVEIVSPEEGLRKWFARNEMSGRYIQMPNLYYHPEVVRGQSKKNKQGGAEAVPQISSEVAEEFKKRGDELTRSARELYDWAVGVGIEKGLARIYNVQNQYTKIRYTASLKNWCDFLYLRLPKDVLWECREVARAVKTIIEAHYPDVIDSWEKLVYKTVRLKENEMRALVQLLGSIEHMEDEPEALYKKLKERLEDLDGQR